MGFGCMFVIDGWIGTRLVVANDVVDATNMVNEFFANNNVRAMILAIVPLPRGLYAAVEGVKSSPAAEDK